MEQNQAWKLLLISNCWAALMGSIMCISWFGLGYQNDSSGHNPACCLQILCLGYIWVLQLGAPEVSRELGGTATTTFLFFFRVLLLQQFRARGRGWGRGNFSGNNNSNSGGNNDFQKRNRDEEWDPEYTPKSKKYYLVCVWSTKTCINPPGIWS